MMTAPATAIPISVEHSYIGPKSKSKLLQQLRYLCLSNSLLSPNSLLHPQWLSFRSSRLLEQHLLNSRWSSVFQGFTRRFEFSGLAIPCQPRPNHAVLVFLDQPTVRLLTRTSARRFRDPLCCICVSLLCPLHWASIHWALAACSASPTLLIVNSHMINLSAWEVGRIEAPQ